jgi:hypothetical protein
MAEGKKSFLLYADLIHTIKQLPDDKAGLLFKHILSYVNDENPVSDDLIVNIGFEPIKQSLKRDLEKYGRIKERNSLNGSKGGRPKKETEKNPKNPVGYLGNPKEPRKADSDSGNVSDSVNDSVKGIKEDYKYPLEREILNSVYSLFDSKYLNDEIKKQKWLDTIRLLIQTDGENKESIIEVVKFGRTDDFWKSNFLSIPALRKKTDGVSKFDKIKAKINNNYGKPKQTSMQVSDFSKPTTKEDLIF